MALTEDLQMLCDKAKAYGASEAIIISTQSIVVDPRVRLKCMVPICPNYGYNLMCPPNVINPDEFIKILSYYRYAILLRVRIQLKWDLITAVGKEASLNEIRDIGNYKEPLVKSERMLVEILRKLERDCLKLGFRFAAGLSAGACRLCDECVGQKSGKVCRRPFDARPSMEAVGIDVIETAKKSGMNISFYGNEEPSWIGLLLVD